MLAPDNAPAKAGESAGSGCGSLRRRKATYTHGGHYGKVNGQGQKRKKETEKEIRFRPKSRPEQAGFFLNTQ
jgi:hypothetical protein